MLIHWIWLATLPHLNERQKLDILDAFHDPEEIFFADSSAYQDVIGLSPDGLNALADKNLRPAEEILDQCIEKDIHICTYHDAGYPVKLKNIADPPLLIYYKGNLLEVDNRPVVAVVGTRRASAYGMSAAARMGYQIAKCGGVVVSGLAAGIDGTAMKGALTAGGNVIGVLGCGADVVYPRCNQSLYRDTEKNGCLLTEFPPGTPPASWNFPKRNRIISGLSNGVLVVEAPEKSGALITARQAADQGRDVFVVPGNIDVSTSEGSNALLRDGAIAVSSGWDVISEYQALYPDKITQNTHTVRLTGMGETDRLVREGGEKTLLKVAQKPEVPGKTSHSFDKKEKTKVDKHDKSPYSDGGGIFESLSDTEQALLRPLLQGECLVDDIMAASDLPAGKILSMLTLLEIKGVIRRLPGKRISLS